MKLLPIRQNLGPEVNPSIEFVPSFNLSNELIDSIKFRLVTCNKINTVGIRILLDFECCDWILTGWTEVGLQMVQILNGIWNIEARPFEIWTNDHHLIKNHLKSGQKCWDFKWFSLQMDGTIAIAKAWPLENWTIWKPINKKSAFQLFPDFRSPLYSGDPKNDPSKSRIFRNTDFWKVSLGMSHFQRVWTITIVIAKVFTLQNQTITA